jgi:1,4-alpha-glucan branching enzyme
VKVAFTLPAEICADEVALCGEFNGWRTGDIKLTRRSSGEWHTIVTLEPGRAYRFRYLLDGQRWENAWDADRYDPNPYGGNDSVLVLE